MMNLVNVHVDVVKILDPERHLTGILTETLKEKKEVFGEGCREDENRVANAQRELHSRMSEGDRDKALKWVSYYRALLQEDYDRT